MMMVRKLRPQYCFSNNDEEEEEDDDDIAITIYDQRQVKQIA